MEKRKQKMDDAALYKRLLVLLSKIEKLKDFASLWEVEFSFKEDESGNEIKSFLISIENSTLDSDSALLFSSDLTASAFDELLVRFDSLMRDLEIEEKKEQRERDEGVTEAVRKLQSSMTTEELELAGIFIMDCSKED